MMLVMMMAIVMRMGMAMVRASKMQPGLGVGLSEWSHQLLNVGAGDGVTGDPLWPLVERGYKGVWVDHGRVTEELRRNLKELRGRRVLDLWTTPENVPELLDIGDVRSVARSLDVLKATLLTLRVHLELTCWAIIRAWQSR